ncbi:MAG: transcription antitermination factor NusB [Chitinophagaceae bacterium]
MLNRRNVRVKVMQALYSNSILEEDYQVINPKQAKDILELRFNEFRRLVCYAFYILCETVEYAKIDKIKKQSKHILDIEEIRKINTKLAESDFFNQMTKKFYLFKIAYNTVNKELFKEFLEIKIKVLYKHISELAIYKEYINDTPEITESMVIKSIWENIIQPSDEWEDILSECLPYADTDEETLNIIFSNLFNNIAKSIGFDDIQHELIYKDRLEFSHKLIDAVATKNEYITQVIKKKLQNWDEDRVSRVDFILLKMGVVELLYFDEIPSKVTLNEYIDISKDYSTPQSAQFINGVLDSIYKDMQLQVKQKP